MPKQIDLLKLIPEYEHLQQRMDEFRPQVVETFDKFNENSGFNYDDV